MTRMACVQRGYGGGCSGSSMRIESIGLDLYDGLQSASRARLGWEHKLSWLPMLQMSNTFGNEYDKTCSGLALTVGNLRVYSWLYVIS